VVKVKIAPKGHNFASKQRDLQAMLVLRYMTGAVACDSGNLSLMTGFECPGLALLYCRRAHNTRGHNVFAAAGASRIGEWSRLP
jgi:hypothetical protein